LRIRQALMHSRLTGYAGAAITGKDMACVINKEYSSDAPINERPTTLSQLDTREQAVDSAWLLYSAATDALGLR